MIWRRKLKLEWKENVQLEKTKRGKYMKGKTPKSTYYDKYGPSGTFTKAAAGSSKITNFFSTKPKDPNILSDNWIEIMDKEDDENEDDNDNEWKVKDLLEKVDF